MTVFGGAAGEQVLVVDRLATYKKLARLLEGRILLSWCWAHQRRDFIAAAAGQVHLTDWCQAWLQRVAAIYRLNRQRLAHYQPGRQRHDEAFADAQQALEAELESLFATAEGELAALEEAAIEGQPLRSLLNHRAGLCVFLERPDVPMDNNFAYSVNGISKVIPEPGLFRYRCLGSRLSLHCRVQNAGIITNCLLLLACLPAYAKEKTNVHNQLLSLGSGGLGSVACRPAWLPCR